MVDWRKIEMPLQDLVKYGSALLVVGGPLLALCVQVGSYKDKVDTLIQQNKDNSHQLYEQSQDINEIKMVLKIRQAEPPQSYNFPENAPLAKEHAPALPQVSFDPTIR